MVKRFVMYIYTKSFPLKRIERQKFRWCLVYTKKIMYEQQWCASVFGEARMYCHKGNVSRTRKVKNKNRPFRTVFIFNSGTPEGIRTPDPLVRSQVLYPAELLARVALSSTYILYHSEFALSSTFLKFSRKIYSIVLRHLTEAGWGIIINK